MFKNLQAKKLLNFQVVVKQVVVNLLAVTQLYLNLAHKPNDYDVIKEYENSNNLFIELLKKLDKLLK